MKSSGLLSLARVPKLSQCRLWVLCLSKAPPDASQEAQHHPAVLCWGRAGCRASGTAPPLGSSWGRGEKHGGFNADNTGSQQPRHRELLYSLAFSAFQRATTLSPWAWRRGMELVPYCPQQGAALEGFRCVSPELKETLSAPSSFSPVMLVITQSLYSALYVRTKVIIGKHGA